MFIDRIYHINHTETWNFKAPTWVTSVSHKIMAKCGILWPKTLLLTEKQLHAIHFLVATHNVCPLAITEPCAQNISLQLLENHSPITGPGFDSPRRRPFFPFFGRFDLSYFAFFKTYFHFLTDLQYTSRLIIAALLSPFISKIISPQVSHGHPLILLTESLLKMAQTTKFMSTVLWQKVNWQTVTGFRYF